MAEHVGGYAVNSTVNLHVCICTYWFNFS